MPPSDVILHPKNTAKRPRAQGCIQHKHQHIPAIEASNQPTSSSQLTEVPSRNTSTTLEHNYQDLALSSITELRKEGHASAVGSGQHRKQYSKEFKLAALTYWREQSEPAPGPGLSKYLIAKNLQIMEKMLKDWISKEDTIVAMQSECSGSDSRESEPDGAGLPSHIHLGEEIIDRAAGAVVRGPVE
ncbi:hypothetical protein BGX38DRAFT_1275753 [Terfezia claveryi]|nr:hypothetical protein BGX38DRAFT_1275753 [Terfezia claveryi]